MEEKTRLRIVSVRCMRASDAACIAAGTPSKELMRRAGEGIYRAGSWKAPVAVVCGKGNNAGDGFVAAELMRRDGIDCTVFLLSEAFSEDGQYYFDACVRAGVPAVRFREGMDFRGFGSVLDCIFGTGFQGDVTGTAKAAIDAVNASGAYVVSADINSGLNGDTGEGTTFVRSDLTVSIGCFKKGLFLGRASEAMKEKVNIDIGIPIIGDSDE